MRTNGGSEGRGALVPPDPSVRRPHGGDVDQGAPRLGPRLASHTGGDYHPSLGWKPPPAGPRTGLRPGALALWGLAATALALGILLCALALIALAGAASLAGGPWGPLGAQVSGAVEQTAQAAAASSRAVRDAFDPSHPPRGALRQDTEFDALQIVGVGELLGPAGQSRVELASIVKRADARDAATAQYAVVRRALVTPQPRRVLGVPLGEDSGEQDHYLYQGQSFRLGNHYYKVNWVSVDRQQVAVARYRSADGVIGPLVFEYD